MSLVFLGIYCIQSNLYKNCSTFFLPFQQQSFKLAFKSWPTCSIAACPPFSKLPTIERHQQYTKASFSAEQSHNFRIITKRLRYCLIGLRSNMTYNIFIVKISYKDQCWKPEIGISPRVINPRPCG